MSEVNKFLDLAYKLSAEAAQENCDSYEYDLMQEASDLLKESSTILEQQAAENDALKAHIERIKFAITDFDKLKLRGSGLDWWNRLTTAATQTPQQSLSERDAEVAMSAIRTALRNFGAPNLTESSIQIFAKEYAQRIKDGQS